MADQTDTTVSPPEPTPPKESDAKPPAIIGPLVALLQSRKALVMICAVIAASVLIGLGKATIEQGGIFVAAVIGVWMNSHAKEEGAKAQAKETP